MCRYRGRGRIVLNPFPRLLWNSTQANSTSKLFILTFTTVTTMEKPFIFFPLWNICKFGLEISYGDLVSFVCHEHHQHDPNNLQIECDAFCVSGLGDGVSTVGGGVRKGGAVVRGFLYKDFGRWLPVLNQVLRWRGKEELRLLLLSRNLVWLVTLEQRCLSPSVVFLNLIFFKSKVSVLQLKVPLSFSSSRRSFR